MLFPLSGRLRGKGPVFDVSRGRLRLLALFLSLFYFDSIDRLSSSLFLSFSFRSVVTMSPSALARLLR